MLLLAHVVLLAPARAATPASAAPSSTAPSVLSLRLLASSCANCHGTDGHAQAGGLPLAGRPASELLAALRAFQRGDRPATVMHQIAKGYTDVQLQTISRYFAAQPPRRSGP